jgi:hypothetical protein
MADEVKLFGRLSLYALVVGTIYWFVSYEFVGTVMLLGFGLATGLAFIILFRRDRKVRAALATDGPGTEDARPYPDPGPRPDGPFGDESGPVPTRSAAPLVVGFGIAVIALGGAFGPWFAVTGLVPVLIGAADWLRAANRELDQRSEADGIVQPDR